MNHPTKKTAAKTAKGFSSAEREAMKARALELKSEARTGKNRAEGEKAVLEAIAAMPKPDRAMATRLHAVIQANAPQLLPRTWYGMPAYADGDGKVVCFFRNASKFKDRYATLGFNDKARLDDGNMWPIAFALATLTTAEEKRVAALVKKAVA
jgi:uncharacterized protein YdhG (YjbR/CyaY superfamily)